MPLMDLLAATALFSPQDLLAPTVHRGIAARLAVPTAAVARFVEDM